LLQRNPYLCLPFACHWTNVYMIWNSNLGSHFPTSWTTGSDGNVKQVTSCIWNIRKCSPPDVMDFSNIKHRLVIRCFVKNTHQCQANPWITHYLTIPRKWNKHSHESLGNKPWSGCPLSSINLKAIVLFEAVSMQNFLQRLGLMKEIVRVRQVNTVHENEERSEWFYLMYKIISGQMNSVGVWTCDASTISHPYAQMGRKKPGPTVTLTHHLGMSKVPVRWTSPQKPHHPESPTFGWIASCRCSHPLPKFTTWRG